MEVEVTRSYRDGTLSLTIPDWFTERPDRETPQRPLVAVITEWDGPEELRHAVTVQIEEPTPQLGTIEQLSAATVARQIAMGRHVAAIDVFAVAGEAWGRRVESVYAAEVGNGLTVVELQYLAIRAGRCVTVSVTLGADRHAIAHSLLELLADTLTLELAAVEVTPDPAAMPPLDAWLQTAPGDDPFEDLSWIRARQPYTSTAPRLSPRDVDVLRGRRVLTHRGDHRAALATAGFFTERGRGLTAAGTLARDLLTRPAAEFQVEVTEPGRIRPYRFHVWGRGWDGLLQADVSPWAAPEDDLPGRDLELIPSSTVAVSAARWLGVAPAWTVGLAEVGAGDPRVSVSQPLWDTCLIDPGVPAPAGMTAAFARMWSESWRLAELRSSAIKRGPALVRILFTGEMGNFLVQYPKPNTAPVVTLAPYSSASLLRLLLIFTGALELPAGDAAS